MRAPTRKAITSFAAIVAAALLLPALVLGAAGSLTKTTSLSSTNGLDGVQDVVVSPDGKHAYASSFDSPGAIVAMDRNPTTGALTYIDSNTASQFDGQDGNDGIAGGEAIAISPDGKHVYIAGNGDDAVAAFSRNANSGNVSFVEAEFDGMGGFTALNGVNDVVVSPDGANVYAASRDDDSLTAFSRNPATGQISFLDEEIDELNTTEGLQQAGGVDVSPDGKNVYVIGYADDAVTTFTRNNPTGTTTFLETDGVGPNTFGPRDVAVSPDGAQVYVLDEEDKSITVFNRNQANGALTAGGTVIQGVNGAQGLATPTELSIAPDGRQVYVGGGVIDKSVATYNRDAASGALSFGELDADAAGFGGFGAGSVTVSPDGANVYATASANSRIITFGREPVAVVPPGPGPNPNPNPQQKLVLKVTGKPKQVAGALKVKVRCSIACKVTALANGRSEGDKFASRKATKRLGAAKTVTVKVKLKAPVLKRIKGQSGKATITVKANGSGQKATKRLKLKLKS